MKKHLLLISIPIFLNSVLVFASELDHDKASQNLSEVLKRERMVPNRDPNTGEVNGYRILDAQKDSAFEQIGLQRMDVIRSDNGEPVDSVQKAMELYNSLKMTNKKNCKLSATVKQKH